MQALFDRLAGTDHEIDSEELQDMLTTSFSKGLLPLLLFLFLLLLLPLSHVNSQASHYLSSLQI